MLLYKMSTIKLKPRDKSIEKLEKLPEPLKPIGQRTRSRRSALGDAKALAAAIKAAEHAKKQTPGNKIKLGPLQMNPILEKDYKQGKRNKPSEKQESRSKSNSSNDVAEEPSEKLIEEPIRTISRGSFLPPVNSSSTNKSSSSFPSIFNRRKSGVPVLRFGGKRKTAKRRRAKKSCGWFW